MSALEIVLQNAGTMVCGECLALHVLRCPDKWFHEATGCCPGCDGIWDIREEHHEDCAMRALCRLALACSELARRAPVKASLIPGTWHPGKN